VGGATAQYTYTIPRTPGTYRVSVTAVDDPGNSDDRRTATSVSRDLLQATVLPYSAPTITGSANQSTIVLGNSTGLTITPRGTTCNKQMAYTCVTTEGTLSGNPTNAFNSTGVRFDADRSRLQTNVVNITCTVRDAAGGTGSTVIPVSVTLAPLQSMRLEDIIFANNSARVNNCGKRIILEELYPQLTEHPDWELYLVGHTATGEANTLDRRRVLNVIAALTGGTDTCRAIEPSRASFSVVGTTANSDTKPGFCGTSTRDPQNERAGQGIVQTDEMAALRRVEVYLVPPGAALPAGATKNTVPLAELKALGCPR
jgi:hypothetical protein